MNTTEYSSTTLHQSFSNQQKRNIIVILVALFPLVFSAIVFTLVVFIGNISFPEKVTPKGEYGEIILPAHKSTIGKKFIISGTITDLPDKQFIYLVENREGLFWPKYALGNKSGTWSKSLSAHGKKGHFSSYILAKVDLEGKKVFEDWFKINRKTGKYLGMADIEFAKSVAKIRVKTK